MLSSFIDYRSVEDTESRKHLLDPGHDLLPSLIIDPLRILKDARIVRTAGRIHPSLIIDPLRILKVYVAQHAPGYDENLH